MTKAKLDYEAMYGDAMEEITKLKGLVSKETSLDQRNRDIGDKERMLNLRKAEMKAEMAEFKAEVAMKCIEDMRLAIRGRGYND